MNIKEKIFTKINEQGLFLCTYCRNCNIYNWPPNNNCKKCFKNTKLKKINNKGIILEISYSHLPNQNSYFGIGDFSGIRILGTVDKNISVNDFIIIDEAKVIDNKILLIFKKLPK
ncbi:MAG: hypothetical protein ACTHKK_03800 [Candidatus Nitrosocosmicus sp.]